ncbi:MAG: hypothetical protein NTZ10_05235 [Candidatus Saganbacteria bacterium]|nr:hypothetical protein [Candidatus Saganbacteria bacterium]
MDCPNLEKNKKYCNCTFSCEKKFKCCECLHYHRQLGEVPACYFSREAEKTGDRSIGNCINP